MENEIKQLVDTVRQTGFEAHAYLRSGHLEKIYENALRNWLRKRGLEVEQQSPIKVYDEDGSLLGDMVADLIVEQRVIVELKAVRALAPEHTAQVLGYLRATGFKHGMLLNFGAPRYEARKLIL